MYQTTAMGCIQSDDPKLTGNESYPIFGNAITQKECQTIMEHCYGLKRHWNCIEKARIAQAVLNRGRVTIGSLLINSFDGKSQYGYYFNPPLEFHAWLIDDENIIDVALPGAIEKGLITCDHIGPYLTGRNPFILAGKAPEWTQYKAVRILS